MARRMFAIELQVVHQCVLTATMVVQATHRVDMVRFVRQISEEVDVSKILMSVSEMVDAGRHVIIDEFTDIDVKELHTKSMAFR